MQLVDCRESLASVPGSCQPVSVERNHVGATAARLPRQNQFSERSLRHVLVAVGQAKHRVSHGIAGIKFQRPLELLDGIVVAPGHVQDDAEVDLRVQRQRVESGGALGERESLGWRVQCTPGKRNRSATQ